MYRQVRNCRNREEGIQIVRISRRLRGTLAAAVTTGALLIPGSAMAIPVSITTIAKDASTPSIEPGAVVKYQVVVTNTGGNVAGGGGNITISANEGGSVTGGVVGATAGANNGLVTVAAAAADGSRDIVIPDGFAAGDPVTVTFDVTLPGQRSLIEDGEGFVVSAFGNDTDLAAAPITAASSATDVYKGDGTRKSKLYSTWSELSSTPAGLADWWVPLGSTVTGTLTVHNWGDGPAYGVGIYADVDADTSAVAPRRRKAGDSGWDFAPVATVVASADCVAGGSASECTFGEIPAGASRSVAITISGSTHLGSTLGPWASISNATPLERNRSYVAPRWNDTDSYVGERPAATVRVTDGGTVTPKLSMKGPRLASGRADTSYALELVNAGPGAITGAVLRIEAPAYTDKGAETSGHVGDVNKVDSVRSITLSNGATCAPAVDHEHFNAATGRYEPKARLGQWDCPIAELAAGARLTGTVVANFATGRVDATVAGAAVNMWEGYVSADVSARIHTAQFAAPGSDPFASSWTRLNRSANADLDVSASSTGFVGPSRLTWVDVTVTNNGPSVAKSASLNGATYKLAGTFHGDLLPGTCTGIADPSWLSCTLGDIAPGASVTVKVPVKAGATLGGLVTTFSVGSEEWDSNEDNNSIGHALQVVKASLVPLQAVVLKPRPVNAKALVAGRGIPTKVTCPTTCKATVQLWVKRPVAQRMKLRMPRKGDVLVGSATRVSNAAGNATVFTKVAKKHQSAFRAYRRPVTLQRKTTAVSTALANLGATTISTQNLTVKPAPLKKPRRPRR